jgi:hypothetical protein
LRTYTLLAIAAVATGLLVGIVIASSGGNGSGSTNQPLPQLTPPGGSVGSRDNTTTTDTTTTDTQTNTQQQSTQTQSTPSGGTQAPPADTKTNDTPPPSGSPAQRFENFCAQNPGAC